MRTARGESWQDARQGLDATRSNQEPGESKPVQNPVIAATTNGNDTVHLPSPLAFLKHSLPALVESVVVPSTLFYCVLVVVGIRGAVLAALAWSYLALARRLARRERVPGMLLLGVSVLTIRTGFAYVTGSAFVYFIQPAATTFAISLAFLATALMRRPLVERLARDFCPLDPDLLTREFLRTFFLRVSLLWGLVLAASSAGIIWMLLVEPVTTFVVGRTIISTLTTLLGIAISTLWFLRTAHRNGVTVRWGTYAAN